MSSIEFIYQRRSIRKYEERPVEKALLLDLLKAGMAAPTASNNQPWEFVVIPAEEGMESLRAVLPYGKHNAPAAIVVCGSYLKGKDDGRTERYWVQDCTAALENMLIAAVGLGLGTVWIGIYPNQDRVEAVKNLLKLPEKVIPLGAVYVGYPAEEKEPGTKYMEDRVHWGKY
ncbi:MAG: nitroreductase family protein [Anaerolineales bacterium]|nr:nitroreductase family protein [Anaerolineales bacterium]